MPLVSQSHAMSSSSEDACSRKEIQMEQERERLRTAQAKRKKVAKVRKERKKILNKKFQNTARERLSMDFVKVVEDFPEDLPVSYFLDFLSSEQRTAAKRVWEKILERNAPAPLARCLKV